MTFTAAYSFFQVSTPAYVAPAHEIKIIKPQALVNVLKQSCVDQVSQHAVERYHSNMQACAHAFKANRAASGFASKPPSPLSGSSVEGSSSQTLNKRKPPVQSVDAGEFRRVKRALDLRPSARLQGQKYVTYFIRNSFNRLNSSFAPAVPTHTGATFYNNHNRVYSMSWYPGSHAVPTKSCCNPNKQTVNTLRFLISHQKN